MYKLFLDDVRDPINASKYMQRRIGVDNLIYLDNDWVVVRNYDDFCLTLQKREVIPYLVSFDHDLADAHKTGADCAKFLVEYCEKLNQELPNCLIHSMNPVGSDHIRAILGINQNFAY